MRTMIAIPCMDMVHTLFFASMLSLRKPEGTEVAVASCSLIYEARHTLAMRALNEGFDRVLWLDHGEVRMLGDPQTVCDAYEGIFREGVKDGTNDP